VTAEPSPLELWFEFASTYSYLALSRATQLTRPVRYQPFLLGPIFAEQGWRDSPFNLYPVKGRYMWRDVERLCEQDGLPFKRPSKFPRHGLLAARISIAHRDEAWLPRFAARVYRANFAEDREIGEASVLGELLSELGVEPRTVLERATLDSTKQALRAQNERAVALGIFGSPTYVAGKELFWGNDRLPQALAWADSPRALRAPSCE
jgi:2-hydroxychromene-2-carboxylate isomerase